MAAPKTSDTITDVVDADDDADADADAACT